MAEGHENGSQNPEKNKQTNKHKIGLNGMGTAVSPFCISSLDLLHWPHEKGSVKEQEDR